MPILYLHNIDKLVVTIYFVVVWAIGVRAREKKKPSAESYILAGRTLTLPAFVATLVATWYGGVLGIGEFCYRYGISSWIIMGVPYYLFAIIYAFILAEKVRAKENLTIPERLYDHYGKATGFVGSILIFLHAIPAAKVLMLGVLIQLIFGIPMIAATTIGAFFSVVYIFAGGFKSVVKTDKIQFVLMMVSFALILPYAIHYTGGFEILKTKLPSENLTITGTHTIGYMSVWFCFALWTLIAPSFHQRCSAAKTPKIAKKGILISVVCWIFLDALMTATGLYARALLPNIDPILAYPMLAQKVLPPLVKGVFFAGFFAFIMSTIDSSFHIVATTFSHDIIRPRKKGVLTFRIGLIIAATAAVIIATLLPSVITIWYVVYTISIPALFLPIITSYFPKYCLKPMPTLAVMLSGGLLSLSWIICGWLYGTVSAPIYFYNIEPLYPGLIVSTVLYIFFVLLPSER
ncbi:MAG: sodium:solute symporter family protein [Waddliaceae bacterium]|jgi:solute:Na+ symporter, SSS family|nr:sodium:solute symporter family protein [Waddliaceae bacterium]